jgi:outer membrane protein assembly factor BamB
MPKPVCFLAGCFFLLLACTRSLPTPPPLATDKNITSFTLKASDNSSVLTSDVVATISGDTIQLRFDSGMVISSLIPTIVISGKTIDPAGQKAEDFSKPLHYVITAEDGSTKTYMTSVTLISNDKKILSFTFRSTDNAPVLNSDVSGVIGADSIFLTLPTATQVTSLKPFIAFSGKTLSPASSLPQDFTSPVRYTVTANNGTTKNYMVKVISGSRTINGTVFIVGVTGGAPASQTQDSGTIYALDAGTGKLKWKYVDDRYIYSEPTVANGLLYSNDAHGNIFTLDINTGKLVWNYAAGTTLLYQSNTIVSGNTVYVCGSDSALYALNALSGALMWKYKDAWGSPTVSNGMVYCISEGIAAVDANTGVQKWKFNPSSDTSVSYPSNPSVVNGILYVGSSDFNLYALDANTGKLLWNFPTGNVVETSPTVVNGIVYLSASAGTVYALDAITGQQLWSFYVGNSVSSSPTIANGFLYFGSNNQYLYALDASTGSVKWTNSDGNWINESPLFFQNVIYVGAQDEFQAVDASTGKFIWRFSDGYRMMLLPCAVDSLGHVYHTSDSGEQN